MMAENLHKVALLHYTAPPVVGGVENVILAHTRVFLEAGYPTAIVAGRGEKNALPPGTDFVLIPELDSKHPEILKLSHELDQGSIPAGFEQMTAQIVERLSSVLASIDTLIVHNVFTKHFNLPLTAALFRLLDRGAIQHCVAWCHDLSWTSPNSLQKVFPAYPWDLLRTYRSDMTYVTISQERQHEMVNLFGCPLEQIRIIYNGVDPGELFALSADGLALINRLDLWESDLNLLMPVRVTHIKNVELALRVVAALKETGIRPLLVLTGPPDPHDEKSMKYFQDLLQLRKDLGADRQMRFVYESGPDPSQPFIIDMSMVAELMRVSDALFMPSHREGFGMSVLEAGLIGIPVFVSDTVPSADEIGAPDVIQFSHNADPEQIADLIFNWSKESHVLRLRQRIRQDFTWQSIFKRKIVPLLEEGTSSSS